MLVQLQTITILYAASYIHIATDHDTYLLATCRTDTIVIAKIFYRIQYYMLHQKVNAITDSTNPNVLLTRKTQL